MKKSDEILKNLKISQGEPSLWEIWKVACESKSLLKHVIDNDLPHIWRIITIILSYLVAASVGYILKAMGIF